jgi:hypothetical protein
MHNTLKIYITSYNKEEYIYIYKEEMYNIYITLVQNNLRRITIFLNLRELK